jgi:FlaA1/EpsC-like NDP-sugar epimerase
MSANHSNMLYLKIIIFTQLKQYIFKGNKHIVLKYISLNSIPCYPISCIKTIVVVVVLITIKFDNPSYKSNLSIIYKLSMIHISGLPSLIQAAMIENLGGLHHTTIHVD